MKDKELPRIRTKKASYTFDYPKAEEFTKRQMDTFWFPNEINVEKDVHCVLTELTDAEKHGVITTLKLFLSYELVVGNEYWGGVVSKYFPRPEIQKMANCFSFFELNVHAPFYNKINEVLGLNTDEFYLSYTEDAVLSERMGYLDNLVSITKSNLPLSLAVFSMIEGAILYSSFAFLKHFESNGKNKITNIVAGVNSSMLDEALHSEAGSWLYIQYLDELSYSPEERDLLEQQILEAAEVLREHEYLIVDKIFSKGGMGANSITKEQLKSFVDHRVQVCLLQLGIQNSLPEDHDTTIEKWFYPGTGYQLHDFFSKVNAAGYVRDWNKDLLTWRTK